MGWTRIPGPWGPGTLWGRKWAGLVAVVIVVAIVAFAEVGKGRIVAAAEAVAIIVAVVSRNRGTAVFHSVFHVRVMVILKVVTGRFDATVEALALNIAELLGRRIPASAIMVGMLPVPVLRWWSLGRAVLS